MDELDLGITTCTGCGQEFAYADMLPAEEGEHNDTQYHWLMSGRCPHCRTAIEVSMEELQATLRDDKA